jgi:hypothetical protein
VCGRVHRSWNRCSCGYIRARGLRRLIAIKGISAGQSVPQGLLQLCVAIGVRLFGWQRGELGGTGGCRPALSPCAD